jgi:DNA polymerase-3 subunit delta'
MAWEIIGHDWAVALLSQSLASGRVAHAYLFSGPSKIGKTRLALNLARALNCTQPEPPCGQCASCLKIERNTHPDVRVIEGEGAGGSTKIDQIRALQREAALSPYEGRYRVYILRRMDLASIEAANSLLKTLEEPAEHVVLVLTAELVEMLPTTVVSRCQRLDLRSAARHVVEDMLRDRGIAARKAQLLARLSGGRVGWAVEAVREEGPLAQRQQELNQLIEVLSANRVDRLDFAWRASRDSMASRALIDLWITWWRDLLLLHGQGEGHMINVDRSDELRSLARRSTLPQVWAALKALQSAAAQLEANVNARLAWEGLLLKLPHWQLVQEDLSVETDA